ncbi:CubicO group peptidase, beta-lactamase class C family [Marinitoga hydrogenitolerans DSM 16785]|uniref:CubicO group peptidase, beta-lactamase class C family n=1 Tax=Marinitoga hydrogenitolerans (strain DSM 16785 / JCM 12826 / AT1271) TaxID=1122195 RepID=A0A1M4WG30_MARH1|nr:serine hydrolase [Marinitoga hydrogenitolerans]SHE80209.1 CubicO group peptidase, beta-lactamase class C family [Marinitoga hydrogenitolerans DSM 16785]
MNYKKEIWNNVDRIINSGIKEKVYPGGTILVGNPENILYSKSYGTIDEKKKTTLDTIYDLASLTKVLATTIAIMKLLSEGYFHLNDTLENFGFKDDKKDITIFNLLTHTSGLPAYSELWKDYNGKTLYNKILETDPENMPDQKIVYSCINFILLMHIIEKITEKKFNDYIESIYRDYEIKNLFFKPYEKISLKIAPTSIRNGNRLIGKPDDELAYYLGGISGNAGLFGNANEIYTLLSHLIKGKIIPKNFFNLFTTTTINIDNIKKHIGWMAPNPGSSAGDILNMYDDAYGHTGFTGTSIWGYRDLFVIFLTNRTYYERFGKNLKKINRIRILLHNVIFGGLL